MIRLVIIGLILLTIGLFILAKIKPETFHTIKEYSILHSLILLGASICGAVSFYLGVYLSVIVKVQSRDIVRYFNYEQSDFVAVIQNVLVGASFLLPFLILIIYILNFKILSKSIVKNLNLQRIIDIYS
jgi:hypothetical protein